MEKFDEIKAELLHDNRPFIPNADIKYIGWLSRAASTKSASTIIVEFTNPEDANKIIDEEPHSSKDCPTKVDKSAIRKCAVCKGAHEAWNNRCPVRKIELSKVKAAYDARQPYHFVPPTKERPPVDRTIIDATPAVMTPTIPPGRQNSKSKSPTKGRAPKRVHLRNGLDSMQDENEDTIMVEDSQRPRRVHVPSRRALESITTNSLLSSQWSTDEP
ncbi:hypothetical protein IFR05_015412 [Cadophora sp. M221]|nr:hypothetical protein IFR05_015412 [Cadophora sp. M221]